VGKAAVGQARLHILKAEKVTRPSFLDWIRAGAVLNVALALDFTASNGDPKLINSLHNQAAANRMRNAVAQEAMLNANFGVDFEPRRSARELAEPHEHRDARNPYVEAMCVFSNIILPYSDGRVAALGFGAKLPPSWTVSHCFALHGRQAQQQKSSKTLPSITSAEYERIANSKSAGALDADAHPAQEQQTLSQCIGERQVLDAYLEALEHVTPSGPTLIAHALRLVGDTCRAVDAANNKRDLRAISGEHAPPPYSIVLIVTDGVPEDLADVRNELLQMSQLGISVVIAGVGNGQLERWERMIADIQPLSGSSARLSRTMCTFVRMSQKDPDSLDALADALAALPMQVLAFLSQSTGGKNSALHAEHLLEQLHRSASMRESALLSCSGTELDSMRESEISRRSHKLDVLAATYTKPSNGKLLRVPTRPADDVAAT